MIQFTPEAIRKYFSDRLPGQSLRGTQVTVQCPMHEDGSASLSINLDKGVWNCHAGCGNGGILAFEKNFSQCDDGEAWAKISELTGFSPSGPKPAAIYVYEDEFSRPLFRVIRYPRDENGKKTFKQQRYVGPGWGDRLDGARRVPYHLPEVITANEVFIVEGEKDADNLRALDLAGSRTDVRVTATTAPGGSSAGTWQGDFSLYMAGKRVFILPDNDEPGRSHAQRVAASVAQYAAGVKIVTLPGLREKGDVSDYLEEHTAEELIAEVRKAPVWKSADKKTDDSFFVGANKLALTVPDAIEWMLKGVIPFGWNGFIVADPKSLKSYSMLDLALHLALGKNWLGLQVPRRVKVAMFAREDFWGLTGWRVKHFQRGMVHDNKITQQEIDSLNDWLLLNTAAQTDTWYLDDDQDLDRAITAMKERKVEFCLMDVFRVLFRGEENDNSEMQEILDRVKRIRNEVGCGIGIVHHARKEASGDIFQRTRGASAIHGFMEFGIGITTENPEADRGERVRKMEFLTKAGNAPPPIRIRSEGGEEEGWIKLVTCESAAPIRQVHRMSEAVKPQQRSFVED